MRKFLILILALNMVFAGPLWSQESVPYNWQNVAIGGGGFVSSIIAAPNDQNVFYARTDVGGAYRWNEATQSWIPLLDWVSSEQKGYLGVDGIAVDPSVPGRVYMLLGIGYLNNGESAFVRSDDYGNTWEVFDITNTFKAHGNGMGRGNGERLAVDPNNSNVIYAGTRYNGLWKSTNRGTSWSQLSLNYTPNIDRGIHESGVCTIAFDKNDVSGGETQTIYAGLSRETNNVFVSHNGGASWSLIAGQPTTAEIRPSRIAITSDGASLYITYGNGGGPHPMLWDGVTDYYNRGAIYKYDVAGGTWTDISPENFMLDLDLIAEGENQMHYGAFSGISIDPSNEERILATSINSWRGPQFWNIDGTWVDSWGDNIYLSEDGGATWREMFRYYWMDGGFYPDYEMISENGFPWIVGEKVHWNGAIVIDPFNPNRAFVPSGNGVFSTDNLLDFYTTTEWVGGVEDTTYHGKATWKFTSAGIEETVPLDLASPPGGPLVSVIGDYDGFVHQNLDQPATTGRHPTTVNGQKTYVGTTTGLAFAYQNPDIMAKSGNNSVVVNNNDVAICGVQLSSDGGLTWNQIYNEPTGVSVIPAEGSFFKGELAISAEGAVVYWSPMSKQNINGTVSDAFHPELFRYVSSGWSKCAGVEFSCDPETDWVNENLVYAYNQTDGYIYVSVDKGANFEQRAFVGLDGYKTMRAAPYNEGDIWIPLADGGLARSTDAGVSFSTINGVSWCEGVGFGKEASGADYPTVFIYGTVSGTTGIYRSTDQGASWVRVNDDQHQYGGPGDASIVIGDMNVFGRVYMTTAGRGIVYGEPSGSNVSVTGVSVSPTSTTVGIGGTTQLTASVTPSNATNKAVSWSSSNSSIASVSSTGLVTGVAAGNVTITVTTADGGYIALAQVSVAAVNVTGVAVSPTSVTLDPGENAQLSATISPANATNQAVNWSTGNSSVATVNANGLVTAVSDGTTIITVTTDDGGFTASAAITVNYVATPVTGVEVSPASLILGVDESATLTASVIPATANNQVVSWSTSDASVATVSSSGIVTGIDVGSATITVTTDDGGYTAISSVTVSDVTTGTILAEYWEGISGTSVSDLTGIADYPDNPTRSEYLSSLEGETNWGDAYGTRIRGYIHPPATGSYTFWIAGDDFCDLYLSSDASEANASRIAYHEGWTNSREWTKYSTQQSSAITLSAGQSYYIEVLQKEGWGGDNIAVAWSGPGIAQAVIDGAYLTPYSGGGPINTPPVAAVSANPISGTAPLAVIFDASASTDADGDALSFSWDFGDGSSATGETASNTYNSAGSYIATVTVSDGQASDQASLTINVTDANVPVTGVSVSPTSVSLNPGGSASVTVSISPANATDQGVSWSTANSAVAAVNASGVITAQSTGSTTVTVTTDDGGYTASVSVSVTSSSVPVTGVSVSPTSASVDVGSTTTLAASVSPSNATNQTVSWSSSNTNVATVNSSGTVTGVAAGSASITVTTNDGSYTATSSITVNALSVPVTGVSVSPTTASVDVGATTSLSAVVSPSNASNQAVSWSTSNAAIATVSSSGVVTGVAEGSASITVTTNDGSFTASAAITVNGGGTTPCANPVSISIPFVQNGAGQYCWVTTTEIDYINSWNLTELTINGVDYTNTWSNSLPPAVNGEWVIYYDGPWAWSHFEAPQAKGAVESISLNDRINLYPNPFNTSFRMVIDNADEITGIQIMDELGRMVQTIGQSEIQPIMELGNNLSVGVYIIKVSTVSQVETFIIHKN